MEDAFFFKLINYFTFSPQSLGVKLSFLFLMFGYEKR